MKLGTVDVKRLSAGGTLAREARLGTQQVYSIFKNPVSALFFRRQTAGGSVTSPALPQYGKALLSTIKGNSMVWNQMFPGWRSGDSKSVSTNTSKTLDQSNNYGTIGHKYYFGFDYWGSSFSGTANLKLLQTGNSYVVESLSVTSSRKHTSYVYNCNRLDTNNIDVTVSAGTFYIDNTVQFDLTLMFGAGNEPSTVAEFERDYPLKYYDYNPGQIINLTGQGLETVGFNQWDEEWESGILDDTTGEPIPFSNRWRTKNFIPCLPGTAYYFHNGGSGALYVFEYDSAQNCIKYTTVSNAALTTQAGTHFFKFYVAGYGATYNHDICINISNATKNGTYEPYWKSTKNLGLDSFDVLDGQGNTITIHGLAKAGSAYDEINASTQKYVKRLIEVDLGDLTYTASPTAQAGKYRFISSNISGIKASTANTVCSRYTSIENTYAADKDGYIIDGQTVIIYAAQYATSDAATFKTAMAGVKMKVELATPEEYDLETPMDAEYRMDYLGTEALIPENSSTPSTAKFSAEIKYPK